MVIPVALLFSSLIQKLMDPIGYFCIDGTVFSNIWSSCSCTVADDASVNGCVN